VPASQRQTAYGWWQSLFAEKASSLVTAPFALPAPAAGRDANRFAPVQA